MSRPYALIIWLEPLAILLLGIPILLPGRFVEITWHPLLLAALLLIRPFGWICTLLVRNKKSLVTESVTTSHYKLITLHPLNVSICLILIWIGIGLWASADRTQSWIVAGYLLFGTALFSTLLNWPPIKATPSYSAIFLLLVGVCLAIISPPLVAWKPDFRLFYLPLYGKLTALPFDFGETIHANVLAGVLVLILPLLLALTWQKKHQILLIFLFSFVLALLVLTQSRGGYLAIAIALPFVVLLRWPRLLYGLVPGSIIAALFIRQMGLHFLLDQLSQDGSLGGWAGRLDIWRNSLQAISDFAFTGIGLGTFTMVMSLLYPLQVSVEGYPHAHNLFFQIGLDLGLPGLIAYLALLINLFVMVMSTLRNPHLLPLHRILTIGATGSLVGMIVHGLLDAVTWGTKLAFVPWLLFALITQLFLYTQVNRSADQL